MIGLDSRVRKVVAAITAVSLLAGCAHVRPANPTSDRVDLRDINSRLADRKVRVRTLDDTVLAADHVRVSADSVYFRLQEPRHLASPALERGDQALPTSQVRSIEVKRRGRGAVDGMVVGFVAGVLLGVAMWVDTSEEPSLSEEVLGFMATCAWGALGTGAGLAIGAAVGSTEVFEITKAP